MYVPTYQIGDTVHELQDDRLYSIEEVADYLGLSRAALAQMRYERRGPKWVKISARVIKYRGRELRQWLDTRLRDSTSADEAPLAA